MISLLGFVLQCAVATAMVGTAVGLAVLGLWRLSRSVAGSWHPAVRADLWLVGGVLPLFAALSAIAATAAPAVASALGWGRDHCPGHGQHFHICFIHAAVISPALATVGAFALASWVFRSVGLAVSVAQACASSRALETLGRPGEGPFPVFVLPAGQLCHATGFFRRRILLSSAIGDRLSPDELASALSHEEAHLQRRDPLSGLFLAAAGLFLPPPLAGWFRRAHRQAVEEACDVAAAVHMGSGTIVADALVKVASFQREVQGPHLASAFGAQGLERRVHSLLETRTFARGAARWPWYGALTAASFALLTSLGTESVHHAVETILGRLF